MIMIIEIVKVTFGVLSSVAFLFSITLRCGYHKRNDNQRDENKPRNINRRIKNKCKKQQDNRTNY